MNHRQIIFPLSIDLSRIELNPLIPVSLKYSSLVMYRVKGIISQSYRSLCTSFIKFTDFSILLFGWAASFLLSLRGFEGRESLSPQLLFHLKFGGLRVIVPRGLVPFRVKGLREFT